MMWGWVVISSSSLLLPFWERRGRPSHYAAAFSYSSERAGPMCVTRRATRVSDQQLSAEIRAIGYQGWLEEPQDHANSGHNLPMLG